MPSSGWIFDVLRSSNFYFTLETATFDNNQAILSVIIIMAASRD